MKNVQMNKSIKRIISQCKRWRFFLLNLLLFLCSSFVIFHYTIKNSSLNKSRPSCSQLIDNEQMFGNMESFNQYPLTLCSERATKHGRHQKVIGVSIDRSNKNKIHSTDQILSSVIQYIVEAKEFYPDWRVRVYYQNVDVTLEQIFQIEQRYDNVDFCDALNIPLLGNVTSFLFGGFVRYLPLADRFVDMFMSRNIFSPIFQREIQSVHQWISSDKLFHIMRDHPRHHHVIMADLWASKIHQNQTIRYQLRKHLTTKYLMSCYYSINGEQDFLKDYLWPIAEKQSIQHDSFHCHKYPLSIPFTKAKLSSTQFVGCRRPCRFDQNPPGPCPVQCISMNHTDLNLC